MKEYKAGDIVFVKTKKELIKYGWTRKFYGYWLIETIGTEQRIHSHMSISMAKFSGKKVTIDKVLEDQYLRSLGYQYSIKECSGYWNNEMLSPTSNKQLEFNF